jgi:hypothetical protein
MTLRIQAREAAPAERFIFNMFDHLRSSSVSPRVNLIRVFHDQVHGAGLRTAQLGWQLHVPVRGLFIHRAQHDHATAERQFCVHDGVAGTGIHGVLFESEDVAQPFNGLRRVAIVHPWYRVAAGGCLVRHANSIAERPLRCPEVETSPSLGAGQRSAMHWARKHVVGKGYFETAGIPILLGHGFRKQDETNDATAVIVSEELVRAYWTGEDVLGRRILIGNGKASGGFGPVPGTFDFRPGVLRKGRQVFEVVGVARDVAEDFIASKKHPAMYFPLRPADYAQPSLRGVTLMVRGIPGVDVIGALQREISSTDPNLAPFNARSMTEQIAQFMSSLRSAAWTWNLIGAFGLILASVGLAGVTAYSVAQRKHEIGIRMALGAQKGDVLRLVMKEGAVVVTTGAIIGMAVTWAGIRLMSRFFFSVASVRNFDPLLLVGAPLLLGSLALLACYLPARRSMRIDPASALRGE